jgi:hypothetical protein
MTNNKTWVQKPSLGTNICPDNSIPIRESEFSLKREDLFNDLYSSIYETRNFIAKIIISG